jgi:hypothetical protein
MEKFILRILYSGIQMSNDAHEASATSLSGRSWNPGGWTEGWAKTKVLVEEEKRHQRRRRPKVPW